MADNVQWIRLKVGMFDGNSFKKIKRAKIGGVSYRDKLTAVWFELLDLAGKSNANGYLIDNNEIPYHSFEDIAVMLDREEKEIELCMGFFITEKMVEIVDDMYCLTNFMQYQNQEGLEKIREQKRLRQARWRERKALGLVDEKASTRPSTTGLPSISISNSNIEDKDIIESNNLTTDNNNNSNVNIDSSNKTVVVSIEEISKWFDIVYAIYPRKVSKVQSKRTFEKKLIGLEIEQAKQKVKAIKRMLETQCEVWKKENNGEGRQLEYIPHFSSWLSANVEDSAKPKGKR